LYIEIAAKEGNEFGQYYLGCYYASYNREDANMIDYEKALFWFLRSAEQGFYHAQRRVALLYLLSNTEKGEREKGDIWFKKSVKQESHMK